MRRCLWGLHGEGLPPVCGRKGTQKMLNTGLPHLKNSKKWLNVSFANPTFLANFALKNCKSFLSFWKARGHFPALLAPE